jgi:hypothetical protein
MPYYRVAMRIHAAQDWQWKSTVLGTLETLLGWLRLYRMVPVDQLRVFSATSKEELNEQLQELNLGLASASVPVANFLHERNMSREGLTGIAPAWKLPEHRRTPEFIIDPAPNVPCVERTGAVRPLYEQNTNHMDRQRMAFESGVGGDHDTTYSFTYPSSMPQVIVWLSLMRQIRSGELQP